MNTKNQILKEAVIDFIKKSDSEDPEFIEETKNTIAHYATEGLANEKFFSSVFKKTKDFFPELTKDQFLDLETLLSNREFLTFLHKNKERPFNITDLIKAEDSFNPLIPLLHIKDIKSIAEHGRKNSFAILADLLKNDVNIFELSEEEIDKKCIDLYKSKIRFKIRYSENQTEEKDIDLEILKQLENLLKK